jgi:hypothetical protein
VQDPSQFCSCEVNRTGFGRAHASAEWALVELTMVVQTAIKGAKFDDIPPEMNPEFHRLLLD